MSQKLKWTICSIILGGLCLNSCVSPQNSQTTKPNDFEGGVQPLKTETLPLPLQPLKTETLPSIPLIPLQPLKTETLPSASVTPLPSPSVSSLPDPLRPSELPPIGLTFKTSEMQFGQHMRDVYLKVHGTEDPFLDASGINTALLESGRDFCKSKAQGVSPDIWLSQKLNSWGDREQQILNYQRLKEMSMGQRPSKSEATLFVQNAENKFSQELREVGNAASSYLCPGEVP